VLHPRVVALTAVELPVTDIPGIQAFLVIKIIIIIINRGRK